MFDGQRIFRVVTFLAACCGLLFVVGLPLLVAGGDLSSVHQAAAVLFVSFAFIPTALILIFSNQRLRLAAALLAAALAVDLVFFLKAARGVQARLAEDCTLGLCLVDSQSSRHAIFGFAEFVTALALLVVLYTITDVRTRFRIRIAPLPLYLLSFVALTAIGFAALFSDVWFAHGWPIPRFAADQLIWQSVLGALFLVVVVAWLWFAFLRPSVFGKRNFHQFTNALYRVILRGSESELATIDDEVTYSARPIVQLAREDYPRLPRDQTETEERRLPNAYDYAHDLILLIANRKFCRAVATTSPATAIAFFEEAIYAEKLHIPLGLFGANVVTEALRNKDSILYHEDEGFYSGLIGYIQPFSKAIFGNFPLVEALAGDYPSPLDISVDLQFSWDADQVETYCRCALVMLDGYFEAGRWYEHSYALVRTLKVIESAPRDVYKLNDQTAIYSNDIFKRLSAIVDFAKEAIEHAGKYPELPFVLRRRGDHKPWHNDFFDNMAELMFEVIFDASAVRAPVDTCWSVQHNAVWGDFFSLGGDGRAWKTVRFKLRRLLYDEVRRMEQYPNYKSAKILGICLNVLGLTLPEKKRAFRSDEYALKKAILAWTKKHYLRLVEVQPEVAAACLAGTVTFDADNARLVKTYVKGLRLEAPKEYLELQKELCNNHAANA